MRIATRSILSHVNQRTHVHHVFLCQTHVPHHVISPPSFLTTLLIFRCCRLRCHILFLLISSHIHTSRLLLVLSHCCLCLSLASRLNAFRLLPPLVFSSFVSYDFPPQPSSSSVALQHVLIDALLECYFVSPYVVST